MPVRDPILDPTTFAWLATCNLPGAMSTVIVRRRPDGILQIRPRSRWQRVAGPMPLTLLALFLACTASLTALMVALVKFPMLLLLLALCGLLALLTARFAMGGRRLAEVPIQADPQQPPRNAA